MSDNVSDIAQLIADGETMLDGEEICSRGLEHIVEEELADYRAEKMINSIDAVLDEQEEQWDEGKEEPGLIAELYAEYAKPLLKEAHLIGLKDAELGYKTWDELFEQEDYKHLKEKPAGSTPRTGEKTVSAGQFQSPKAPKDRVSRTTSSGSRSKVKNKVKAFDNGSKPYIAPVEKKKVKKSKEKIRTPPKKWNSATSSASESSMSSFDTPSLGSRSQASSFVLKHQNSVSSINSCTLREDDDLDSFLPEKQGKLNSMSLNARLGGIDEDTNKPKKKKSNRRTASERKHGSEASPFIYNRHGKLTFRKADVEKLKREKREKRKTAIRGSLGKFLVEDDEEDDILAGILSGR